MADCKDQKYNIFNPDFDKETGNEVVDDPTTGSAGDSTQVVVDVDAYDAIGNGTGVDKLTASLGSSRLDITTTGGASVSFSASSNTINIDSPIYVTSGSDGMLAYYDGAGSQLNDAINLYYDDTGKKLGIQTLTPSGSLTISGSDNTLLFLAQSNISSSILAVTGSGRVGINSSIPSSSLHVESEVELAARFINRGSTNSAIQIWAAGSSDTSNIYFHDGEASRINSGRGAINYYHSSDYFMFTVGGDQRLKLASNGYLTPTGDNTQRFGASDARWQQIYVGQDLIISGSSANVRLTGSDSSRLLDINSTSNDNIFTISGSGHAAFGLAPSTSRLTVQSSDSNVLDLRRSGYSKQIIFRVSTNNQIMSNNGHLTIDHDYYENAKFYSGGGMQISSSQAGDSAFLKITGSDNVTLFGVHSATNANILTVTGSGRVGINTTTPSAQLTISASEGSGTIIPFGVYGNDASSTKAAEIKVTANHMGQFYLYRGGSTQFSFDAQTGASTFNDMGFSGGHTRMESDNNTHMLYVDATNDRVAVGTSSPTHTLTVNGNAAFAGDVEVTGTITANKFVVSTTFITSSIIYESGSTQFGDTSDDTHQFTGSILVNGSISGNSVISSSAPVSASDLYLPLDGKLVFNSDSDHKNYISADGNDSMIKFFMNDTHLAEFQDNVFVMRNANLFMLDGKELKFGNSDDFTFKFNTTTDRLEGFRDTSGTEETRLHINQSGYFGIGDTNHSASALLHVSGSDWTTLFKVNSDTNDNIINVSGSGIVGIKAAPQSGYALNVGGDVRVVNSRVLAEEFVWYSNSSAGYIKWDDGQLFNGVTRVSASTNARLEVTGSDNSYPFGVHTTSHANLLTVSGSGVGIRCLPGDIYNALTVNAVGTGPCALFKNATTNARLGIRFGTTTILNATDGNSAGTIGGGMDVNLNYADHTKFVGGGLLEVSSSGGRIAVTGSDNSTLFGVHSTTNANILTVTGSGKVGIGTVNPSSSLHIFNGDTGNTGLISTDYDDLVIESTNDVGIQLVSSHDQAATIGFVQDANGKRGWIQVQSNDSPHMDFGVGGASRMYIDPTGVGIGTASPTHKLTVNGATLISGSTARLEVTGSDNSTLFGVHTDNKTDILKVSGSGLTILTGPGGSSSPTAPTSNTVLFLDNSTGDSNSKAQLDINSAGAGGAQVRFFEAGTEYSSIVGTNDSLMFKTETAMAGDEPIIFMPASTEALRIDKVAISASVPLTGTRFCADGGSSTRMAYAFNVGNQSQPDSRMGFYAGSTTSLYLVMGSNQKILWDSNNDTMRMGDMGISFGSSVGGNIASDITYRGGGVLNLNSVIRISGSRALYDGAQSRFEVTGSGPVPMLSVHSDVSASILEVTASGQVIINDGHATLPGLKFKSQDATGAGIYFRDGGASESNDALFFLPNDNENNSLVVRGNGFVGVGDHYPNNKLVVIETSSRPIIMSWNSSTTSWDSSNYNGSVAFHGYHGGSMAGIVDHSGQHSDADNSRITGLRAVGENSDGDGHTQGTIEFSHDGTAKDEKGQIQFKVNDGDDGDSPSVTAMTIKSNGYVGIGQIFATGSAPSASLHVYGQSETYPLVVTRQTTGDLGIKLAKQNSGHWNILNEGNRLSFAYLGTDGTSNTKLLRLETSGQLMPDADDSAKLGGASNRWSELHVGSIFETSERALKENIVSQASQLDNIMKLNPVEFNWKNGSKKSKGFIADEVSEVFPELVSTDETGKATGIEYTKMISVLTQGMKELNEVVKSQQETIEKLIKKIEEKN